MPEYDPERIFVGGLPSTCDSDEKLAAFFSTIGPVLEAKVCLDTATGRPKGFGFVRFDSPDYVEAAIANDAQNVIDGKWVKVKRCELGGAGGHKARWEGSTSSVEDAGLWVRGLPLDFTETDLRAFFGRFGSVVDCKILPRRFPNNPDQAALVRMGNRDEAQWCVDNLDNTVQQDFPITLTVRFSMRTMGDHAPSEPPPRSGAPSEPPPRSGTPQGLQVTSPPRPADAVAQAAAILASTPGGLDALLKAANAVGGPTAAAVSAVLAPQPHAPPPTLTMHPPRQHGQPLAAEPSSNRLWVRGLPLGFTDDAFREFFSKFGHVSDCAVLPQKYPQNPDLAGVVRMTTPEAARWCIDNVNGMYIEGCHIPLSVKWAREDQPKPPAALALPPALPVALPPALSPARKPLRSPHEDLVSSVMRSVRAPHEDLVSSVMRVVRGGGGAVPEPPRPVKVPRRIPAAAAAADAATGVVSLRAQAGQKVYESDRIFVGGLPNSCSSEDLALFFCQYGAILEATVNMDPATGRSKGFGFVRYESPEAVDLALLNEANNVIDGKLVRVKRGEAPRSALAAAAASPPPPLAVVPPRRGEPLAPAADDAMTLAVRTPTGETTGLWIRGLPLDFDEARLGEFFSQFAEVVECRILPRRFPDNPDQAGLVRLASADAVSWCIDQLNGTHPQGFPRPISCKVSTSTAPPARHHAPAVDAWGASTSAAALPPLIAPGASVSKRPLGSSFGDGALAGALAKLRRTS